jgi:hypothetical protein
MTPASEAEVRRILMNLLFVLKNIVTSTRITLELADREADEPPEGSRRPPVP